MTWHIFADSTNFYMFWFFGRIVLHNGLYGMKLHKLCIKFALLRFLLFHMRPIFIHGHGIFFHGGGSLLHKPKFRRGGGQFFWGNFRILLHFYYQILSENFGWLVCLPKGGLSKKGGGPPIYPPPHPRVCTFFQRRKLSKKVSHSALQSREALFLKLPSRKVDTTSCVNLILALYFLHIIMQFSINIFASIKP